MKRLLSAPLLLALAAASAPQPLVEVATGDWSNLPALEIARYSHLSTAIMTKLNEIKRKHRCDLAGQGNNLDMSISFAAQFRPDGRLTRVLLPPLHCAEAESWIGSTLVQSLEGGDFVRRENNPEGWYRGNLSFYWEN